MKFKAEIDIMPLEALLDPQGKAVAAGLENLGIHGVEGVRIGKHIRIVLEASDFEAATQQVELACSKLLANLIMERYVYQIEQV